MIDSDIQKMQRWGECYYDHFTKHLGNPLDRRRFEQDQTTPIIQIISYENIFGGCRAFCSFGLSLYSLYVGEVAEVFMPVDDAWDDTPSILAGVLFHMVQMQKRIGWGLAIRFADIFPDFVTQFGKSTIYFSVPFGVPKGFNKVKCDSEVGEVYLASYISENERDYLINNGAHKFEELLEKHTVDVFNISRESCI